LVDDLLDVSRISRGKIELRRARMDLRHALDSALEATRDLIARSGHSLAVERPDVPVWVDGDAARLAQVFSNLLTNA
ncbi:MAG TPA: hybrid sensor histidine kinase/response regulator, partial [Myxococcales bacterium]|nr:hybrid sensor histidine kinase/response regulator [Myxococcales bacterium]